MSLRVEIKGVQRSKDYFYYSQTFKWHWDVSLEIHIATLHNLVTIFLFTIQGCQIKKPVRIGVSVCAMVETSEKQSVKCQQYIFIIAKGLSHYKTPSKKGRGVRHL